ncbi:exodeoxyribonuclease VII large subunit [Texcoconibacillus texcoconensis]|uniref:Exodeoxyribonuclease 7 large subunit n=1 Tax=Texcoconibacillus texcoconensis TaxID=1095777 RepID=A0A840QNZ0_9BACI|nr:exodeoxyribonuclease VII large subunit [Texcoconibacillus texcoconensis]MBB5173068.1 exodeoxyribonuclease VII large subunit [Texcoconibacillus texcoconensis]
MANDQFYSVSSLTKWVKRLIDRDDALQNIWVRAEISNFKKHSRGHMYFTLKDEKSRVQSVMFAGNNRHLTFIPENGMSVLVRGDVSVYEPYGQYQFYVKDMQPDGMGNLFLAYEQLKKKLANQGWFDNEKKRQIPNYPRSIAVVTSRTGAAVRDIVTTLKRRFPQVQITLFPVLVQGEGAAPAIVHAIRQADAMKKFDVMIFGRGGGSIEELWAFNEEAVAEAIYHCSIPTISAVGHETDVTISDFVADLRAPTPTAAAELAVPDTMEVEAKRRYLEQKLFKAVREKVTMEKERLGYLTKSYAFRYPRRLLQQKEEELDRNTERLRKETRRLGEQKRLQYEQLVKQLRAQHPSQQIATAYERLGQVNHLLIHAAGKQKEAYQSRYDQIVSKLDALSPLKVMNRGYSLVYEEKDALVKTVSTVNIGDQVKVRLQDGSFDCQVKDVHHERNSREE